MPITDARYKALSLENVDKSPRKRGVYALYVDKQLVFLGSAAGKQDTIRSRLRSHLTPVPTAAMQYKREKAADPDARLKDLLEEYQASHGKLPERNRRKRG